MATRHTYVKREAQTVAAVQLDLDTKGFTYEKWGSTQTCKPGDWIVSNDGDWTKLTDIPLVHLDELAKATCPTTRG